MTQPPYILRRHAPPTATLLYKTAPLKTALLSGALLLTALLLCACAGRPIDSGSTARTTPPSSVADYLRHADRLCQLPAEPEGDYSGPRYSSLWDRLRAGYQLQQIDDPRIERYVANYARHPHYLIRVGERGAPFLFHIVDELERRGMPLELALLPVVESAFDPFAYSHGRAAGLWQFIPGTGRQFGLKQNWWYDGRRDVLAATEAALTYLSELQQRLDGDWLLALAAYNAGEGNVRKAIRRNRKAGKPTDYWSLPLPRETRAYVPRLLALSRVVREPSAYDVALPPIPNQPFLAVVDTGSQIDLAQAASMAGITIKELYQYNAGFNRWATDPEGPHRLLVPIQHAEQLRQRLGQADADQKVVWERYRVRSGDTLSSVALRHRTTVEVIRESNDLRGHLIRAGQMLLVPRASADQQHYVGSQQQRLARTQARAEGPAGSEKIEYRVKSGDSFWTIARRHGVQVAQLARWNGMAPRDTLRPRQKLVIWVPKQTLATLGPRDKTRDGVVRKVSYQVRRGDSLARIASRFNLLINDIVDWNTLDRADYLRPGQRLTLYVNVTGLAGRSD